MKQTRFLIPILFLVATFFLRNGFSQNYVYYATVRGHQGISEALFSPDGQILAGASDDGSVYLWDTETGEQKKILTGHPGFIITIAALSFSSDSRTLVIANRDGSVRLWNAATGQLDKTLIEGTEQLWDASISPDRQTIASLIFDDSSSIRLWNIATVRPYTTVAVDPSVRRICFSPDSQTLAGASNDGTIYLWDAETGKEKKMLAGHTSIVGDVTFSPDGQMLASASWDRTVRLWDAATGQHKKTITNKAGCLAFSPDGRILAGGTGRYTSVGSGYEGIIYLWDAATGQHKETITGHTAAVSCLAFSPDGRILVSVGASGQIRLWKVADPRRVPSNCSTPPKPTANQIYDNAIRSVMWIVNPGISEGSGVLFDKKFKLAVTNAHVTDEQNTIDVYFPAPDENGELIKDRNFYLTSRGVLKRLGYYTKGHVVARNEDTDLVIIRLDGLPETAREINWNFSTPTTNAGNLVYILGNPGGQDLWRWTLGEFLNDHGDFLHIQSDIFGGNSGGPVLNKQGVLIGIVARGDRHMNALAIPGRDINRLLSKSQLEHSRSGR